MQVFHVVSDIRPLTDTKQISQTIKGQVKSSIKKGIDTRVIMPLYKQIKEKYETENIARDSIFIGEKEKYLGVEYKEIEGVKYYFIDNMEYFYRDNHFGYDDDGERYTFFCYAVLKSLELINEYPDILHLHDWYTGLIPHLLKAKFKYDDRYLNIRTMFTIHDINHQGIFPIEMEQIFDVEPTPIFYLDEKINFLKAAAVEADIVTTTSKTFEFESKTKIVNSRLRFTLRDRNGDYKGILNGIDYDYYNPKEDKYIYKHFDSTDVLKGKLENKKAFKKEFGFEDKDCMLVGYSSDLSVSKGMDLMTEVLEKLIVETDIQFFFVGQGEQKYVDFLEYLAHKYPNQFKCYIGKNTEISHKLYASADMILLPYIYEPFSAGQLISMHYGSVPFVHEVGALKDVLIPYNQYSDLGTGFSYINDTRDDFLKVFDYAYGLYRFNRKSWDKIINKISSMDLSWDHQMNDYIVLYNRLLDLNKQ